MRSSSALILIILVSFVGCGGDDESNVRWSDVEAAQTTFAGNPHSVQARQEYVDALAAYLNDHPGDDRASELFLEEEVAYARFLTEKGRYGSAIPYYEDAVARAPRNDALATELAAVRARIVVPRERFEQLSRSMDKDQVRDLLGSPRPGWTHTIDKAGRSYETWYYKREDGGTASVAFVDDALLLAEYGEILRLD